MLSHCDFSLFKQMLTEVSSHHHLLKIFAAHQCDDKMKYMIDIMKCDPTDPRYELLHVAAGSHNEKLVDICLGEYEINPLLRNCEWNKTALEECNWAWKIYQEKLAVNQTNIIQFGGEKEGIYDDIKESISMSYDNIYIRSVLLSEFVYIFKDKNVCFCNVAKQFKKYAQFTLESIGNDQYLIKVRNRGSNGIYERIRSLKANDDTQNDFILTANIAENNIEFVAQSQDGKVNDNQLWSINEEIKGNDEGYTFSLQIKDRQYQLCATQNSELKLEIIKNDQDDNKMDNEGSNFNDIIKSWFIVLKDHEFESGWIKYEW